jgi:ADP-heptose:LPS heptosyltransferase
MFLLIGYDEHSTGCLVAVIGIRQRAEGALFAPLLLVLFPVWLAARLARPGRGAGDAFRATLRRWGCFLREGLKPLRDIWYPALSLESPWDVWRCVILLELFAVANLFRGDDPAGSADPALRRVLAVKLGHFGDLLHLVPMLRSLRRQRPQAELDLLVGPWCLGLAHKIPYRSRVYVYSPRLALFNRDDTRGGRSLIGEWRFLRQLRQARYDVLITSSFTSIIELLLVVAVRPRAWVGMASKQELYPVPAFPLTGAYDSVRYEAAMSCSLLGRLGLDPGDDRLEYWLEPSAEQAATDRLAGHGVEAAAPLAVMAPGAGWEGKQWEEEKFSQAADYLAGHCGLTVVLIGSGAERALVDRVQRGMKQAGVNLAGETSWDEVAALIKRARLYIGNDSGPMHLAAVYEVPSITIFGPTYESKWAPRGDRHLVLRSPYTCLGCVAWHPRARCVNARQCMKEISIEDMMRAIDRQWSRAAARVP